MARSEDPTTFSHTWQEPQQGYAAHDPQMQHPQPGYGASPQGYAPQQPYAGDPAAHAVAPQQGGYYEQPAAPAQQYAEPQYAEPQYAQPEAYPALDPQTGGVQAAQPSYGSYEQTAAQEQQLYAQQGYQQAAPQGYDQAPTQPAAYNYADPATQQPQGYTGEPTQQPYTGQVYADQAYAEPTQTYAPAAQFQEQTYTHPVTAPVGGQVAADQYADYAATQDPYQQAQNYGQVQPHASQPQDMLGGYEPATGSVGFGDPAVHREPTFGNDVQPGAYPELTSQSQFAEPVRTEPGYADFGGQQQFDGQSAAPQLDPGLFAQPEDLTQPAAVGGAFAGAGTYDQGFQTQPVGGHDDFTQPAGYDQRFQTQQAGYDQRFEQPAQGQYGGDLVGDVNHPQMGYADGYGQPGQEAGTDMAPVIADQQVEPSRGRRGLIVVGALVAAVGIGGALGFAYKYSNDSGRLAGGSPPTIKAQRTAAKKTPEAAARKKSVSSDALARRLQTNRAAGASKTRLVSREEPLSGNGTSGVSLRSGTSGQVNNAGTRVTSLQANENGNRANVPGVRRVKTLKVNPDGSFAVPSTRTVVGGGDTLSLSGVSLGSIPKARKVKAKRINVAEAVQAARKNSATLPKLSGAVPKPQPAAARKQVARLAPTPAPSVASSGGGGLGYVVQVSARRSRIDALAAFADLQQRYTGALSAKQPDIQDVNLGGTRGKWYRVRIGPPGSKNAAYNLCNRLKKSGLKDCLIKAY